MSSNGYKIIRIPKKIRFSDVLGPTYNENDTRRQKEWDQEDNTKHSMYKYVQ